MRRFALLSICALALVVASCGGDDPAGPGRSPDPRVVYSPTPGDITLAYADSVVLGVQVVPELPFTVSFTMGDSVVGTAPAYVVRGDALGRRHYTATVVVDHEGTAVYFDDDWTVSIVADTDTPTPPPNSVEAGPGPEPGTVSARWDRPPDRNINVPLTGYEIAWSTSRFLGEQFELQTIQFVADNPTSIRQSGVVDAQAEHDSVFVRVRSVDQADRRSDPSPLVAGRSTGSFTISGRVLEIPEAGWPIPVGSAKVEAAGRIVTTVADGQFVLGGLPDVQPVVLEAAEGSGLYTLPVRSSPLDPVNRQLDLVLVPRANVDVLDEDGVWSTATYREFLLDATGHANGLPPWDFHPWSQYPVKVWVWPFSSEVGEQPSYDAAFRRAIDLWNDGLTGDQRLLEYVAVDDSLFDPSGDPSLEGVIFRLYPTGGNANLGQVDFVRPANGRITEDDPELLKITVRRGLQNQALVDRVIAHELGHTLGLQHTLSRTNLMHMTSDLAQGVPTPEELYVARFLRHAGPYMKSNWIVEQ